MGNYNPHAPHIIGQEWVPIRNEDLELTPASNTIEVGHTFTLAQSRILQEARFYIHDWPQGWAAGQVFMASIYNNGTEDRSGPIRSVILPCSSGSLTGAGVFGDSLVDAVMDPSDGTYIGILLNSTPNENADFYFSVSPYAQLLNGKRILGVDLLYTLSTETTSVDFGDMDPTVDAAWAIGNNVGSNVQYASFRSGTMPFDNQRIAAKNVYRRRFGEVDTFWSTSLSPGTVDRMPWTFAGLQRFESTNANRHPVKFITTWNNGTTSYGAQIGYVALEVFFCEETRVAVGARAFGQQEITSPFSTVQSQQPYTYQTNVIPLRTIAQASNPTLAAGNYVTLLSSADVGDMEMVQANNGSICCGDIFATAQVASAKYPLLNAARELYQLPSHIGTEVIIPFPRDRSAIDTQFSSMQTAILPQLTLHTSGGPLTEVHVYGQQAVGQVYGTITVTQEIQDGLAGGATTWPWIRFIARRWGDTTVPLTATVASQSVTISVADFDNLTTLIDGWKEVPLRFTTPPTMGSGTNPQVVFSATGESAGNRWEILGAAAPAITGAPGNLIRQVSGAQILSSATYGQPVSGAIINMGWIPQYGPYVSGTTDDNTSDVSVIFAQDMPTITGFTATMTSQPVTGIGQECGLDPCGIPTAIFYNQLTWSPLPGAINVDDTFERVSAGFGTATPSGQTYVDSGGTVPGNYNVTGTVGTHTLDGVANVLRTSSISDSVTNSHHRLILSTNVASAGASHRAGIMAHFADVNNHDFVELRFATSGLAELIIGRVSGGVTTINSAFNDGNYQANQQWVLDVDLNGTNIRAKIWMNGNPEPVSYQLESTATFTSGGVGLRSLRSTGNTNTDAVISFHDYQVTASTWDFGAFELQRSDTVDNIWQTIMRATSPGVYSFNDYEARVGVVSSYRIRAIDLYDFYGSWSSTATATVISPGVSGGCCLDTGNVLIFTSNERQSGSVNLAYSTAWEAGQTVDEGFTFPESQFVQMQAMYDRDFFVAFRPLERGGEQFQRTLLVQAAAIAPETLADFRSLRDMAWADASYICVRDEDSNRWFATVLVPSGRVLRGRRLYLAPVQVMEVTDTPSEVDPS